MAPSPASSNDPRSGLKPWQIAFALGTAAGTWFLVQLIARSLS
jgi:hypothetical protein